MMPKNLQDKSHRELTGDALARWENEGGTMGDDDPVRQYGRRVEPDKSWTVYHVFTGKPAVEDDRSMTGLSRSAATEGMLSLNRSKAERHIYRQSRLAYVGFGPFATEGYRW
jgi:hypothetical protein